MMLGKSEAKATIKGSGMYNNSCVTKGCPIKYW